MQISPEEGEQYLSPANYRKLSKIMELLGESGDNGLPNELTINELLSSKAENAMQGMIFS